MELKATQHVFKQSQAAEGTPRQPPSLPLLAVPSKVAIAPSGPDLGGAGREGDFKHLWPLVVLLSCNGAVIASVQPLAFCSSQTFRQLQFENIKRRTLEIIKIF